MIFRRTPRRRSPQQPDAERLLLQKRVVVLGSEVDNAAADRIVAQLLLMDQADPTADIHFCINSPGGFVTAGMAILDTVHLIRPDVVTWAAGLAAGMAQVLLSGGTPGKRYAAPHARIMLQKSTAPPDADQSTLAVLDRTNEEMIAIVATQTGQPVEQITADSAAGRWFSAAEALDYGLIDGIRTRPALNPQ